MSALVRAVVVWLSVLVVTAGALPGSARLLCAQEEPAVEEGQPIPLGMWRYTFTQPGDAWTRPDFDDSQWPQGQAGFGTSDATDGVVNTAWNTPEIWLRRKVTFDQIPAVVSLLVHHDDLVDVFVNNWKITRVPGKTTKYEYVELDTSARWSIQTGENVICLYCKDPSAPRYLDLYLIDAEATPLPPELKPAQP